VAAELADDLICEQRQTVGVESDDRPDRPYLGEAPQGFGPALPLGTSGACCKLEHMDVLALMISATSIGVSFCCFAMANSRSTLKGVGAPTGSTGPFRANGSPGARWREATVRGSARSSLEERNWVCGSGRLMRVVLRRGAGNPIRIAVHEVHPPFSTRLSLSAIPLDRRPNGSCKLLLTASLQIVKVRLDLIEQPPGALALRRE
jgi:hypothetical protein